MENFAPGLRESVVNLSVTLRFVVFFVCVAGLMMQVRAARTDVESVMGPIVRAIVVTGLVATLPHWFGFTEKIFLSVADAVDEGYTEHPMQVAARLRDTMTDSTTEFSLRRIEESLYKAFLWASAKLVVIVASLLQLPFLVLQFILKLLCYLFLPVALAIFMIPSQAGLATRYVQQTLAVLAWPVGFAVTDLVGYHLLTAYANNLAVAYGLRPGEIDAASYGSLLGGLLGAIWIILGTVGTPFIMQGLICSGSPMTGGGPGAVQQLTALYSAMAAIKTVSTGGAAAPAAALAATSASRGSGGPGLPPLPPPPAPSAPPPSPSPAQPDPAGDQRAAAVLAMAQLPAPATTI